VNRRSFPVAILGAAFAAPAQQAPCAGRFVGKLKGRWARSRDYTLQMLDRMPDDHLHFRPTPEVWTFAQQLTHLADGNFLMAAPLRGEQREFVGAPRDLARRDLRKHLEESFAFVAEAFEGVTDEATEQSVDFMGGRQSQGQLCYGILDHVTHHRAQALVYLRLKGIEPPPYPG
jgi:uncharacterized damage-inducible protein DinB